MNSKSEKLMQEELADLLITRAALRALFLAHPNPTALREYWDLAISRAWTDAHLVGPMPPGMQDALRRAADSLQSFLPPLGGSKTD